ncbi:MAG TPA: hypothetical protein VHV54_25940 [Candidatus Binatia bacterium]|jgi:hypothetical protein|nr:hypothetical protein [Candidatus Binatia bacterium]
MAVLRYNDHYISVFLTPDKSGNSSCIPFVEIRHKHDHGPVARLMLDEAFATAIEASVYGLKRGKQWIDEKLAASKALKAGGAVK